MRIANLSIINFRNIQKASLSGLADLNIFVGKNGSGKTSILEAINFLSSAKSFRSQRIQHVIHKGSESCLVVAQDFDLLTLGVQKSLDGSAVIRHSGDTIRSASQLADILPLQVINEDTFQLLTAGPQHRRQMMDWGVFHVEPKFYHCWVQCQKALKQRNALLRQYKQATPLPLLETWSDLLCESSLQLDGFRNDWFDKFSSLVKPILEELLPQIFESISFSYSRGWDKKRDLMTCLDDGLSTDLHRGFTHYGPHRADIKVRVDGVPAEEVLSRGQQKLVVAAMKITQQRILDEINKTSSYVIDDLSAELDGINAGKLLNLILSGKSVEQVFLTAISEADIPCIDNIYEKKITMFHVEHGVINPAE